ncbi:ribosome small subunit-dependent GTPase A [Mycoplasma sp. Ms02]|uniref:ribosome small subunit-dependent GTPase A n=1 Tax=Mycoplasma sp. Ms02 TaxID=353851 RepID=UPI001C8945FB|nr:ribosome small subunit-dependent GTPase A [Mycoplasma sp. Ms02]QZE12636.1 ribosome small subunit-dependent GTPase A [Mycoplasma sp. Ms02]
MVGKVFSINSGIYKIKSESGEIFKIPAAGKLRHLGESPLVGDWVEFNEGMILSIKPRSNYFIRPKVANVDQVFLVMSLKEPDFSSFLLDKYLSVIEYEDIAPYILITKSDLDSNDEWYQKYKREGYNVFKIDNNEKNYKKDLDAFFKDKTSLFMGQTGVGKTTTINYLSDNTYNTQAISKALGRGKHTTRIVRIIEFNGGELIDTPGFSSLILNLTKQELANSFQAFKHGATQCKFRTCLHINERAEDCFIKKSVEKGEISNWRYENYLKLSLEAFENKFEKDKYEKK